MAVGCEKKLGGQFPRPEARKQMDRYAQKLRKLKQKKTRDIMMGVPKKEELKPEEQIQVIWILGHC